MLSYKLSYSKALGSSSRAAAYMSCTCRVHNSSSKHSRQHAPSATRC
jgi:hypothetical protein